jgi:DNA modification methylase
MSWKILNADARQVPLKDNSVDAIITDPPYGLTQNKKGGSGAASLNLKSPAGRSRVTTGGGFMGQKWDAVVPGVEYWLEALRVLKPGAYLLAFGGTRTFHRLTCAIEDAGFEIRDCIMWLYGSGFPKSLDVSKAIDKAAGAEREIVGEKVRGDVQAAKRNGVTMAAAEANRNNTAIFGYGIEKLTAPSTDAAKEWQGWGTALKPAWENIIVAQKPFPESTERSIIVANLLKLEAQLWSILPARIAEQHFKLSQAEHDAALAFARWDVEQPKNIWDDLRAKTDTSLCVSAINTSLSIVSSWRSALVAHFDEMSTSTTSERESKTNPTIDLKILKLCLSALTPSIIIKAELQAPGLQLNALPAARYLNAVVTSINAIQELSVLGDAIDEAQRLHPEEIGLGLRPKFQPIIVARKPIIGTVAENVQRYGTGALNIDGCRINLDGDYKCGANGRPSQTGLGDNYDPTKANHHSNVGRWPANLILDEEAAALLDEQSGELTSGKTVSRAKTTSGHQGNVYGAESRGADPIDWYGDTGGASRFFKTVSLNEIESLFCNAKAIIIAWNQDLANTADDLSFLSSDHVASALSHAAILASQGRLGLSDSTHHFMSATPRELRKLCESLITAILSLEKNVSPELQQEKPFPNGCLVKIAATQRRTDITTITISRWKSNGSVEPATFNITLFNTVRGEADSANRFHYTAKADKADRGEGNNHPTVKPQDLIEYLIKLVSKPGAIILDPFSGSGTTALVADKMNRRGIGMDLERKYCELGNRRCYDDAPLLGAMA